MPLLSDFKLMGYAFVDDDDDRLLSEMGFKYKLPLFFACVYGRYDGFLLFNLELSLTSSVHCHTLIQLPRAYY